MMLIYRFFQKEDETEEKTRVERNHFPIAAIVMPVN